MADFALHPRLEADTIPVTSLGLSQLLLMNDDRFPWLILVPKQPDLKDLHDLSSDDQVLVMGEIDRASRILQAIHSPEKINVAALGNVVPQLHIHVIARFTNDVAWPAPVWGVGEAEAYDDAALTAVLATLRNAFG